MGYRPISDYGVVGNDDRCALVASDGSVDWCCFPTVASPSVFAAIVDAEAGGHFSIEPTARYDSEQRYREGTNVLETRFETDAGRATVTDFMPVSLHDTDDRFQHALFRHVSCTDGHLALAADFKPRPDYARAETTVERVDGAIAVAADGDRLLTLRTCGPPSLEATPGRAVGTAHLSAGEEGWLAMLWDHDRPITPSVCREAEAHTTSYWRTWVENLEERARAIAGDEPWYDAVVRSGLILKLLINEGSGAIYAAPTTSLPEDFGGGANWDYRYNWIRDAKFTVQALYNLGQGEAVSDYFEWFRSISHEDPADMQPVYGVHGEEDLTERTLDHLAGHRFSRPVRIGNAAATQRQIDIYGTIVQGIYETMLHEESFTAADWRSVRPIVDHVCDVWDEAGAGIWEYRDESRHYVHSKLMSWVALDRGIDLAGYVDEDVDLERWRRERAALREAIESRGYSDRAGSFVQHFETEETLDATCLLIPLFGFLPPDDERVRSTIDTVMDELMSEAGLVHRTTGPDSRSDGPGAFLFCSFWLVDALVLADRVDEARDVFTTVLDHVDPPYVLAERIDPTTDEYYGNVPQAFSHLGLINSAIYLQCASDDVDLALDPLADAQVQPIFRS